MKQERDLKGLIKAIRRQRIEEATQAADAIIEIGEAAVEPLITLLEDANRSSWLRVRYSLRSYLVAKALGKIGDARAVEPLIGALNEPITRWHAANALGMIGEVAIGSLTKALENLGDEERAYVVDVAKRALVEKKGFAPTHLKAVQDSPKASAEPRIWLDSSGKIEISKHTSDVLHGKKSARAVAEEKEVHKQPELAGAPKFICSECGEEIPNAIRYEPPDLTMRCSGIARQCSCGWTCCFRCDPTYNQPENGHKCPRCGKFHSGWVRWDPHRNMVDRSGWTQIDGETDHWFKGGLWKQWKKDRESDRWTTIQRALAKRFNLGMK